MELIPLLALSLGQLNLYAYCNDNPVSYTDESGTIAGVDDAIFWGAVFIVTLITTAVVESQTHLIYNAVNGIGQGIYNAFDNRSSYVEGYVVSPDISNIYVNAAFGVIGSITYEAEHTSNQNPANLEKHQKGQKRKRTDKPGGEKGDKRRPFRRNGKNTKM